MNVVQEIVEKLKKYPQAKYRIDASSITVFPLSDTGFTVDLVFGYQTFTVSFNGWHEDFSDQEDALNCFSFGLSDECRLKEYRRGSFAYRWEVESVENGEWVSDSVTGLLLVPFWKKKTVHYLQNNLISSAGTSVGLTLEVSK